MLNNIRRLLSTALLDTTHYIYFNPDVKLYKKGARSHFYKYGYNEGRRCKLFFSKEYKIHEPADIQQFAFDVPQKKCVHCTCNGARMSCRKFIEERNSPYINDGPAFNGLAYNSLHIDVLNSIYSPLEHYTEYGEEEGRDAYRGMPDRIKGSGLIDSYLHSLIQEAELISLDIFDTLITRNVLAPSDIFIEVGEKLGVDPVEFSLIRSKCEQQARKQIKDNTENEITLNDIYLEVFKTYEIPVDVMINAEIQVELDNIVITDFGLQIISLLSRLNKKVIYVSDMYLPSDIIKNMLSDYVHIKDDSLYLSSFHLDTKHHGGLFEKVINANGHIKPDDILHIGDSHHSDFYMPQKYGIKSYHVKNINSIVKNNTSLAIYKNYSAKSEVDYVVSKLLATRMNSRALDEYYSGTVYTIRDLGYLILGPFVLGLISEILRRIEDENDAELLFLERDGWLLHKIFSMNELMDKYKYSSKYIPSSRVLAFSILFNDDKDIFFEAFSRDGNDLNLKDGLRKKFGFIAANNESLIKYGDQYVNDIPRSYIKKQIFPMLEEWSLTIRHHMSQYWLKDTLADLDNKKIHLIDSGYRGTSQRAIESLIKAEAHGLYLGTFNEIEDHDLSYETLLGDDFDNFIPHLPILEAFMSSTDGSPIGLSEKEVIRKSRPHDAFVSLIGEIHAGALEFIESVLGSGKIVTDYNLDADPLYQLFESPPIDLIKPLVDIPAEDDFAGLQSYWALIHDTSDKQAVWHGAERVLSS